MAVSATSRFRPDDDEREFKRLIGEIYDKRKDPQYVKFVMDKEGYDSALVEQELQNIQSYETGVPVQTQQGAVDTEGLTSGQFKSKGFADRMFASDKIISDMESGIAGKGFLASIEQAIDEKQVGGTIQNRYVSSEFQQFDQAKRDFINAKLRQESGAAIADSEFASAAKQYFPAPGDTEATLKQKKANRDLVTRGQFEEAGIDYEAVAGGTEQTDTPLSLDSPEQAAQWLEQNPNSPQADEVRAKLEGIGGETGGEADSFLAGSAKAIETRLGKFEEAMEESKDATFWEKAAGRHAFRAVAQIVGIAGDVFMEGLEELPEDVKEKATDTLNSLAKTDTGQAALVKLEQYDRWAEEHPEIAKDIEAAGLLAEVIPINRILGLSEKVLSKSKRIAGKSADVLKESGKVVGRKVFGGKTPEVRIDKIKKELDSISQGRANLRNFKEAARKKGIDVDEELAGTNLLQGTVDDSGTITTIGKGGAIEQYNRKFISKLDQEVSDALKKSGETVGLADVEAKLMQSLDKSGIAGSVKDTAVRRIQKEIDALTKEAINGNITLEILNNTKKTLRKTINYDNPEAKEIEKLITRSLADTIEKGTTSVDVGNINRQLTKHYTVVDYLEKLNGAKVEGGRLGKIASGTSGTVIGTGAGAIGGGFVGSLVGGLVGQQLGAKIKGFLMKRTFGKEIDFKIKNGKPLTQADANIIGKKLEE